VWQKGVSPGTSNGECHHLEGKLLEETLGKQSTSLPGDVGKGGKGDQHTVPWSEKSKEGAREKEGTTINNIGDPVRSIERLILKSMLGKEGLAQLYPQRRRGKIWQGNQGARSQNKGGNSKSLFSGETSLAGGPKIK